MDCFFCSKDGTRSKAVGVCIDCGCAACERHATVEDVRTSVRTGNMFEERPARARRFRCVACQTAIAVG